MTAENENVRHHKGSLVGKWVQVDPTVQIYDGNWKTSTWDLKAELGLDRYEDGLIPPLKVITDETTSLRRPNSTLSAVPKPQPVGTVPRGEDTRFVEVKLPETGKTTKLCTKRLKFVPPPEGPQAS